MKYKAFVFDVDGTLTDMRTRKVIPSAAEAIGRLQEKGYLVITATGRPVYFMDNVDAAGIRPDYYIASNGHLIADGEGKTVYQELFEPELYHEINEYCQENNLGLFWKFPDCCYVYVDHPLMEKIAEGNKAFVYGYHPDEEALPNSGALVGVEKDRQKFMERFAGRLECVDGGLMLFDINKLHVSKKNGLEYLLDKLGIRPEEIMAFGDSENAIEMIDYAGLGVVMGDGFDVCKQHADYIAEETYNDGIMKALKYFGIL